MSETLNLMSPTKQIWILSLDNRDLRSLITNENFVAYSAYTDTYIHECIHTCISMCTYVSVCKTGKFS